jgi:hypothetical protein
VSLPAPDAMPEQQLRRARPQPRPEFVAALEERLFPAPEPRPLLRRRALFAGVATAGGLAVLTLAFGLAGGGPLGSNETPSAGQDCRSVTVKERVRVREPFVDQQGRLRVRTVPRLVERQVERCR